MLTLHCYLVLNLSGDSIVDMSSVSSASLPDTFIISLPVLQLHRQVHNSTTAFSISSVTERDSLASSLTQSCFLIKWLLVDFSLVDTAYSSRYCYLESMRAPPLIKAFPPGLTCVQSAGGTMRRGKISFLWRNGKDVHSLLRCIRVPCSFSDGCLWVNTSPK